MVSMATWGSCTSCQLIWFRANRKELRPQPVTAEGRGLKQPLSEQEHHAFHLVRRERRIRGRSHSGDERNVSDRDDEE